MPGEKRKRSVIDLETKMKIIRKYEGGQTITSISHELNYATSTINTIVKDAPRIREAAKDTPTMKATIITKQRKGAINEMEKLLSMWMEDLAQKSVPLSKQLIQAKARSLFEDIKGKYSDGEQTFTASSGWFNRFKNRSGFHNVKVSGEAASGDTEAAKKFPEWLHKIIDEGSYLPEQIFNVDETALFYHKMPDRTYIAKEEKTMPGHKASKKRVTLLLGGNASGTFKLKPLLIHTSANPRAFKGITKTTLPVHYRSNKKAWTTIALFEDWFKNCFLSEVEKYCKNNNLPFKILLIIDNATGHPTNLDDIFPNVKVVYLPPNTTALLQPMDQGVISNFKAYYTRRTFTQAINALEDNPELTLRDFWKNYNIYDAVENIAAAWAEVTERCLKGVWKKLTPHFFADIQDFPENDEILEVEQVVTEIVRLAENLLLEVNEDDVEELLASHGEELTNEDLIELQAAKVADNENSDTDEPEEDPKRFTAKDMKEAVQTLNKLYTLTEKQDADVSRFLQFQRKVDDAFSFYKEVYEEKKRATVQTSLDQFFTRKEQLQTQPSTSTDPAFGGEPSSASCTVTNTRKPDLIGLDSDSESSDENDPSIMH